MIQLEIIAITLGFVLDLLIGDPYQMPHPIKFFGNAITWAEKKWNYGKNRKAKGVIIASLLIIVTFIVFSVIKNLSEYNKYIEVGVAAIFIFYGLANRMLINEVLKVNKVLSEKGLEAGRKQLSFIVGRETSNLSEQEIRKASLETLAENLSDGVVAPLFYLFLGGFPLMLTYKMVNTLDSMIGYKNNRYKDFGFFAAKTDDVFNYIPARITAFLMAMASFRFKSFEFIFKYGNKHSSPNAGFPESALAGALNCQFGGPSVYHGKMVDKPFIGEKKLIFCLKHVYYACAINLLSSIWALTIGFVLLYLFN